MSIHRSNPYLNEFIDLMEQLYREVGGNVMVAWERLGHAEKDFMRNEITHCMADPRYYLENYHTIRTEEAGLTTLSPFWDSQELFYNEVMRLRELKGAVRIMVLKARQLGISTVCEGLVFWKTLFTPVCNTLIVATDTVKADHQFEMSRLAHDCLPWWMRPEVRYDQKGRILEFDRKDEWMRKVSPGLRSKIIVEAANKSTGVARGLTIRCCHLSELATWEGGGETLTQQIFPTMNASDVMAFMESTAEGRSGFWYRFWKDTADGKTSWHPVFIPFYKVRKYSTPIPKSETFVATRDEEQYRHKILDDSGYEISDAVLNWRRKQIQEFVSLEGDEFGFMQEYPANAMEAFQGKGVCAFNKRLLYKMVETTCAAPRWVGEISYDIDSRMHHEKLHRVEPGEVLHNPKTEDRLWVWEKPETEGIYYVAADVAQGAEGGDFSCVEVMKIGAGMEPDVQVAEWRGWMNPTPFAYVIAAMGYWYNTAEISVECNNVGKVTNNEIYRIIQYENVYRWKHIDKIKNSLSNFIGWETTWKSRDALIAKMGEAVIDRNLTVRSELLVDEMLDFSYDEDGGGKAQGQSTKDDRVMAMMICRYCAHDSDYGRQAMARPMNSADADMGVYYVLDQENRKIAEFADHSAAYQEFVKHKNQGYSIMKGPQTKDYANTLYSPIHEGFGLRSRMYYEMGYTAEEINNESVSVEQAAETAPSAADPNAWMYY